MEAPKAHRHTPPKLLRPLALAGRPQELPVALACGLALLVVFLSDIKTPIEVALSGLGLVPLLVAMWLLSDRSAIALGALAVGQLIVTAILGALNPITVASEVTAYVVLAVLCRMYARGIAQLLPRARPAPPARPVRGLDRLTRREHEVVILAARGHTAREIGVALHIGKRTVETHLVNAYDKLGVRSKRELIEAVPAGSAPLPADA